MASAARVVTPAAPVTPPAPTTDFNLQVTPSPLVTTIKPGEKTQVELKIHNGGTGVEYLKIEPRSFTLSNNSTSVNLLDTTPPDIASWMSFSQPKFTVQPGQWMSEMITFNVPKTAGFSYSFALIVNRQVDATPTAGSRVVKASLAVFTLLNVDRPDATSSLKVSGFTASKKVYEYLPAAFSVRFQNTGNTIAQPYGNIYVQRNPDSKTPIGSLIVNETRGYILPGTQRVITATWSDGFPAYQAAPNADGSTSQQLVWNWTKLSQLRIGRYTAHLVAVYNQAGHDVPITGDVTFWVIPWKILLVPLVVVLLLLFAAFVIIRSMVRGTKRSAKKRKAKKATAETDSDSDDEPTETPVKKPKKKAKTPKKISINSENNEAENSGDSGSDDD